MNYKLCCYGTFKKCIQCEECLDNVECELEKRSRKEEKHEQGEHNR